MPQASTSGIGGMVRRIWTPSRLQASVLWQVGSTAHVYPASSCRIELSMSGHDGLFARRLPIAYTGFSHRASHGLCRGRRPVCHRSAGSAIVRGVPLQKESVFPKRVPGVDLSPRRERAHNPCPCLSMAQAIRTVLLANATAATFGWRRVERHDPPARWVVFVPGRAYHGACAVDQQGAQIGVAPFADAEQVILAPRDLLPWCDTDRRRHLPAVFTLRGIAYGRDQCGGDDRPYAASLQQPFRQRIVLRDRLDLPVQFPDPAIETEHIAPQAGKGPPKAVRQPVFGAYEPAARQYPVAPYSWVPPNRILRPNRGSGLPWPCAAPRAPAGCDVPPGCPAAPPSLP